MLTSVIPQWIIEKKRDGGALSEAEIRDFINGYVSGAVPDYQMSALAMAVFFQGMTPGETAALTDAMMRSGSVLDTSSIAAPKIDKHSTGGIGDKVSLVLAPVAACCGLAVPMISGRGLGITGGTLDKLESIPGYRTNLSPAEFLRVVASCGCSIIGQTADLAPADRRFYALRDVTGTVPSIPLIAASIMSKKLAEGLDALVLDVKCGTGAFMKTRDEARALANAITAIGRSMGKGMTAIVTGMNEPLGRTVGNALEVLETIDALHGRGPADLVEVTLVLAAHMLVLGRIAGDIRQGRRLAEDQVKSGRAFDKFLEMVRLHGGRTDALENPSSLPSAAIVRDLPAPSAGYVNRMDAELLGRAACLLGAGRTRVDERIDPAVGLSGIRKTGESVACGEPLLTLHANDEAKLEQAAAMAIRACGVSSVPPPPPGLILETL